MNTNTLDNLIGYGTLAGMVVGSIVWARAFMRACRIPNGKVNTHA